MASYVYRSHYLEWLFEGGVFALLLIVMLLGLYLVQWGKVRTREAWSRFRFVQIGAGIGIFLLLLHELVDYNLHIPANMVHFAFLAGIFFSDSDRYAANGTRHGRKRHSPDLVQSAVPDKPVGVGPVSDQIKNPFLD